VYVNDAFGTAHRAHRFVSDRLDFLCRPVTVKAWNSREYNTGSGQFCWEITRSH